MANMEIPSSLLMRMAQHLEQHGLKREGKVLLWLTVLLFRWLVGLHSYSGANTPPMFGDYEAQRHWMEITLNLPVSDWYFNTTANDLLYWGLDYPPLTAYVSYAFGFLANVLEPELVALQASRGFESPTGKVFMRTSVLVCDVLLFVPAILWLVRRMGRAQSWSQKTVMAAVILLQPAVLLIDHGHFQYNNVCLGFTALAIALLWKDQEVLASIAFSLALNFKQMALYYAPAVGIYLLSKCIYRNLMILHIIKLGVAVVLTFGVLWYPFCAFPRAGESCLSSVGQVIHRIFPFARGLFEDKVANVWCVLDLVIKLKRRVAPALQMRLWYGAVPHTMSLVKLTAKTLVASSTISTLVGFFPSILDLVRRKPTRFRFLLALVNSSLSFFLFSFQVHEKSILLPLLPVSLLYSWSPLLSTWFSFLSTFSMFFLLRKDGLIIPYIVLQALFFGAAMLPALSSGAYTTHNVAPGHDAHGRPSSALQYYVLLSTIGTVVIHLAQATIAPPLRYPHIFDYLFAAYSCGHFVLALGYCTFWQWTTTGMEPDTTQKTTEKHKQKHE